MNTKKALKILRFITLPTLTFLTSCASSNTQDYQISKQANATYNQQKNIHAKIQSVSETLELRIKKDEQSVFGRIIHKDYWGQLYEQSIDEKQANIITIGFAQNFNKTLYLSPYAGFQDRTDPLSEFFSDDIKAGFIGIEGEGIIQKPVTLLGDFKLTLLETTKTDYSTRIGLQYYLPEGAISPRLTYWHESLRNVSTGIFHIFFNHTIPKTDNLQFLCYTGLGKEHGMRDNIVINAGTKFSYELHKRIIIETIYDYYTDQNTENNSIGIGFRIY